MTEPNWKELYFALATAVGRYERVALGVRDGIADGGDYWEAVNEMDRLLGEALCWRDHPDLYAELLRKRDAALAVTAGDGTGGREEG